MRPEALTKEPERPIPAGGTDEKRAHNDFLAFIKYLFPAYQAKPFHILLANKMQQVCDGTIKRLIVSCPPRHGKSQQCSVFFPPYFLGHHPDKRIIATSYSGDLVLGFSRQARNTLASEEYRRIFPDVDVAADSRAVDFWNLAAPRRGGYAAAGVGGALTGRGADCILIDDPVKDAAEASSETVLRNIWDWYTTTAYTRLEHDAAVVIIMCLAGDTPILMEDGSEKPLRAIRPGDRIATYDNGAVAVSTVRNWADQGPDRVFAIRMASGVIVKANARHPFLVQTMRGPEWQRTSSLSKGSIILRVIGANGGVSPAQKTGATSQPSPWAGAVPTMANGDESRDDPSHQTIPLRGVGHAFATVMALMKTIMSGCLPRRVACAPSASSRPSPASRHAPIGEVSCASTIATTQGRSEGSSATTAISLSATPKQSPVCSQPLSTCAIIGDTVLEVVDAGIENVFDIEVERTATFIANGLVSHNTRWSDDDLVGKVLEQAKNDPLADQWHVLNLPAEAGDDDPLGREVGEALWPEKYPKERLAAIKANNPRGYSALYQGDPAPAEGNIFKMDWMRHYDPPVERGPYRLIELHYDTAVKKGKTNDYTACWAAGLTYQNMIHVFEVWWERLEFPGLIERIKSDYERWTLMGRRPTGIYIEDKASGSSLVQTLVDQTRLPVHAVPVEGDKVARAIASTSYYEHGQVLHPKGAPWLIDYWNKFMLRFPAGKHDDPVDASTQGVRHLMDQAMLANNELPSAGGERPQTLPPIAGVAIAMAAMGAPIALPPELVALAGGLHRPRF